MDNPPETVIRQDELRAQLDRLRPALMAVRGVNGNGVGVALDAVQRLRRGTGGMPSVRPEDIVVTVSFESEEALALARSQTDAMLVGIPHEYHVGRYVTLRAI